MIQSAESILNLEKGTARDFRRVMLVGPLEVSRLGVRVLLDSLFPVDTYTEAGTPREALECSRRDPPGLVLFDLYPRDIHRSELLAFLRARSTAARTLALIDPSIPRGFCGALLENGLDGIIEKHARRAEWAACLQDLACGQRHLCRRMRAALLPGRLPARESPAPHPLASLSNRETQVFQWIGCGHSTRDVATRLALSPKTIETYREHIKTKLGLANGTELIRAAGQWVEKGIIDAKTAPSTPRANAR